MQEQAQHRNEIFYSSIFLLLHKVDLEYNTFKANI